VNVLDLFMGTGSATQPFRECPKGHRVVGVDKYSHPPARVPDVIGDVRHLPVDASAFDFIWASPPCTEFSPLSKLAAKRGFRPWPDPEKGMELVRSAFDEARKAPAWAIENVRGAVPYITKEFGRPKLGWAGRWVWASFEFEGFMPANLDAARKSRMRSDRLPEATWRIRQKAKELGMRDRGEGWSAVRAMIPRPLAEAVHRAVCDPEG